MSVIYIVFVSEVLYINFIIIYWVFSKSWCCVKVLQMVPAQVWIHFYLDLLIIHARSLLIVALAWAITIHCHILQKTSYRQWMTTWMVSVVRHFVKNCNNDLVQMKFLYFNVTYTFKLFLIRSKLYIIYSITIGTLAK